MNKVVDKLKKRKKELGLTNKALSTTSGVPYGTVCRVLANNIDGTPNWQTIKDLAQAMGMSMEELLDEEDNQETKNIAEEAASQESLASTDEDQISAKALATMAQSYEALLDERQRMLDMKNEIIASKDKIIASKEKWLTRLFISCCILVGIIVAVLIFDLLNPFVGFFQR